MSKYSKQLCSASIVVGSFSCLSLSSSLSSYSVTTCYLLLEICRLYQTHNYQLSTHLLALGSFSYHHSLFSSLHLPLLFISLMKYLLLVLQNVSSFVFMNFYICQDKGYILSSSCTSWLPPKSGCTNMGMRSFPG